MTNANAGIASAFAPRDRWISEARSKLFRLLVFSGVAICSTARAANLSSTPFGRTPTGVPVRCYTMTSRSGVEVSFISFGASITRVITPDRHGHRASIVLGFPTLSEYEGGPAGSLNGLYFGAIIGRYANFIAKGHFKLDGHEYNLAQNYLGNFINGGNDGFETKVWSVRPQRRAGRSVSALLEYTSPSGEAGFPGTVWVSVLYSLSDDGVFTMHYEGRSDQDTVINLTNHTAFNLTGAGPKDILHQLLTVDAERYLPTDKTQIPLGPLASVDGTPFDFRRPVAFGARIQNQNEQLLLAHGYDQYWVLTKQLGADEPQHAVHVYDPESGRTLDCYTTEPGIVIYSESFLDGSFTGVGGRYPRFAGFTLETQHFPNSPNKPSYPSTLLTPGQRYSSTTTLRFGIGH